MSESSSRQPRISNEVLEERLTQYFERTTEALEAINEKLDRIEGRVEREEDRASLIDQRLRDHEHLVYHPEAERRLNSLDRTIVGIQGEITKLNRVNEIEKSVINIGTTVDVLKQDVSTMKAKQNFEDGVMKGKTEVFSGADKAFVRVAVVVSILGSLVAVLSTIGII